MSSNLSRRQFVRAGLLGVSALGTLGLAACSGDGANGSDAGRAGSDAGQAGSDGTIELKYWYSWTDKIKENNEERVKEFNETVGKEKGIHVTAEYQGSYDDLNSKLKTAFTANEEPDVCVMVINGTQAFADGGMIQPISDLIAKEDLDDFWPGLMKNCYASDELYGVPYLRSTPVFYYNKTLFEKAGLDASKAPATWDDVVAASDALKAAGVAGYGFYSYVWVMTAFTYCNGGTLFTDQITAPSATFNEAPAAETVEWFKKGVAEHGFSFSAGATDLLFSASLPAAANTWMIIPLGFAAFVVFYLVFRFAIVKFDLKTPGREDDDTEAEKQVVLANNDYTKVGEIVLEGIGGKDNVVSLDNCITRLRFEIKDYTKVDEKKIKSAGVAGVIRPRTMFRLSSEPRFSL